MINKLHLEFVRRMYSIAVVMLDHRDMFTCGSRGNEIKCQDDDNNETYGSNRNGDVTVIRCVRCYQCEQILKEKKRLKRLLLLLLL